MTGEIPPAASTKEKVLSAGKSEEAFNAKVEEIRAKYGGALSTTDFLYYIAAQQLGIEMPQVTTLDRRGKGGPLLELALKDATADLARKNKEGRYKLAGWVFNQREGKTGKNTDKIEMMVTDGEYCIGAKVQGDKPSAKWRELGIKDGSYVLIEGADLFAAEKWTTASMGLGIADITPTTPPKPFEETLRDGWKYAIPPGGICKIQGFVTAEENKAFEVCQVCGTSVRGMGEGNGKPCCKSSVRVEIRRRKVTLSNGDRKGTVAFSPAMNPPADVTFYGKFLSVVGVYNKEYEEYSVLSWTSDNQTFVKRHEQVFTQAPIQTATVANVDEIFENYVRRHGSIVEVAVLRALKVKLRIEQEDAQKLIEDRVKSGLIKRTGVAPSTNLVWAKEGLPETNGGSQTPSSGLANRPGEAIAPPTGETVALRVKSLAAETAAPMEKILEAWPEYRMATSSILAKLKAEGVVFEPSAGLVQWVG